MTGHVGPRVAHLLLYVFRGRFGEGGGVHDHSSRRSGRSGALGSRDVEVGERRARAGRRDRQGVGRVQIVVSGPAALVPLTAIARTAHPVVVAVTAPCSPRRTTGAWHRGHAHRYWPCS